MARLKLVQNLQSLGDGQESPHERPPWGGGVPRFAIPKELEAPSNRPHSSASTRCPSSLARSAVSASGPPTRPSSASTSRASPRYVRPRASLPPSRDTSQSRQQSVSGAMTERLHPKPGSISEAGQQPQPAVASPRHCTIAPADESLPPPEWYRPEGAPTPKGCTFLPDYQLWVTLHGGNGNWQKRRARSEWEQQQLDHRLSERERSNAEVALRLRRAEAERRRRAADEELRLRVQEAERERRRRQESEARLRAEREEAERRRRLEEERLWLLSQPRACPSCTGTGRCAACAGQGCTSTLYFAERVKTEAGVVCGRLPLGCPFCGGKGDGADWGEFKSGSGRCAECHGEGRVPAPQGPGHHEDGKDKARQFQLA